MATVNRRNIVLSEPSRDERFVFGGVQYDPWMAWHLIQTKVIKSRLAEIPVDEYLKALSIPANRDKPMTNEAQGVGILMRVDWPYVAKIEPARLAEPGIAVESKYGTLIIDGNHRLIRKFMDSEKTFQVHYITKKDLTKIIVGTKQYNELKRRLKTKAAFFVPAFDAQGNPEGKFYLGKLQFDQVNGIGNVPMNQSVAYHGFACLMTPKQFLALAQKRTFEDSSLEFLTTAIANDQAIGSPFLTVNRDNKGGYKVADHEGRTRMQAIADTHGQVPVLVHVFTGFARARDLTPQIVEAMRDSLVAQKATAPIRGPHFGPKVFLQGQWTDVATTQSVDGKARQALARLLVSASTDWINDKYKRDLLSRIREGIEDLDFFNTDLAYIAKFETLLKQISARPQAAVPQPAETAE